MVDDACLVGFGILVLGVAQCCPEGVEAFKMYLYSFPFAHFFELFTCIGYVGYYYGGLNFGFVCGVAAAGIVGGVIGLLLGLGELVVPLVEGPGGELAMFEGCFDVV